MRIVGRDGETLAQSRQGSPKAHLGVSVSGFPNLFFLLGPNTGLGHNSVLLMVEAQTAWTAGGCASWYMDSTGRNSTLWPWSVRAYRRRLARFDASELRVTRPRPARVVATAGSTD